jgi:hypothetical protein
MKKSNSKKPLLASIKKISKPKDGTVKLILDDVKPKELKLIVNAAILDAKVTKEELLYQAGKNLNTPLKDLLVGAFCKIALEDLVKKENQKDPQSLKLEQALRSLPYRPC